MFGSKVSCFAPVGVDRHQTAMIMIFNFLTKNRRKIMLFKKVFLFRRPRHRVRKFCGESFCSWFLIEIYQNKFWFERLIQLKCIHFNGIEFKNDLKTSDSPQSSAFFRIKTCFYITKHKIPEVLWKKSFVSEFNNGGPHDHNLLIILLCLNWFF